LLGVRLHVRRSSLAFLFGVCAALEQFVAGSPDLAVRSPMQDGNTVALREVILHMVEEYARHLGHADLLRERIDGRVGQ
jgi:Protein of unknown function (DUF664)